MFNGIDRLPMSKIISLREANQAFSRCVREVEEGEEFTITRNGEPVARLVPAGVKRVLTPEQEAARARLRARMEKGWPLGIGKINRDELYAEARTPYDPSRHDAKRHSE
jgi:prevent-host-death family protein